VLWGEGLPVPCGARGEPSVYCGGRAALPMAAAVASYSCIYAISIPIKKPVKSRTK
jgi:hypothetical protein